MKERNTVTVVVWDQLRILPSVSVFQNANYCKAQTTTCYCSFTETVYIISSERHRLYFGSYLSISVCIKSKACYTRVRGSCPLCWKFDSLGASSATVEFACFKLYNDAFRMISQQSYWSCCSISYMLVYFSLTEKHKRNKCALLKTTVWLFHLLCHNYW